MAPVGRARRRIPKLTGVGAVRVNVPTKLILKPLVYARVLFPAYRLPIRDEDPPSLVLILMAIAGVSDVGVPVQHSANVFLGGLAGIEV
jgi:hypothetical protein